MTTQPEPSKESLERAQKWLEAVSHQHGWELCAGCAASLALEFDAIARERDEVTEKLAEALGKMLERHCRAESPTQCTHLYAVEALAAYRERMGRS